MEKMRDIIKTHRCISTEPYFVKRIMSHSEPGKTYEVTVIMPGDDPSEHICTCPGFHWRGHCNHQHITVCGWHEMQGPEEFEGSDCPRCGNLVIEDYAYDLGADDDD